MAADGSPTCFDTWFGVYRLGADLPRLKRIDQQWHNAKRIEQKPIPKSLVRQSRPRTWDQTRSLQLMEALITNKLDVRQFRALRVGAIRQLTYWWLIKTHIWHKTLDNSNSIIRALFVDSGKAFNTSTVSVKLTALNNHFCQVVSSDQKLGLFYFTRSSEVPSKGYCREELDSAPLRLSNTLRRQISTSTAIVDQSGIYPSHAICSQPDSPMVSS